MSVGCDPGVFPLFLQIFFQIDMVFFRYDPVNLPEMAFDLLIQLLVIIADRLIPHKRILVGIGFNFCAIQKVILQLNILFVDQEPYNFIKDVFYEIFHFQPQSYEDKGGSRWAEPIAEVSRRHRRGVFLLEEERRKGQTETIATKNPSVIKAMAEKAGKSET